MALHRTFGRNGGVVAAAFFVALLCIAVAPGVVSATNPKVIHGVRHGPVDIRGGTYGNVGSLALPTGAWLVTATGYVQGSSSVRIFCDLVMGSGLDHVEIMLTGDSGGVGSWEPLHVMLAHRFASPGVATLRCKSNGFDGDALARELRLTAMRAGKLRTYTIGGAPTTTGTGTPFIVSGHLASSGDIAGDDMYHYLGSIHLTQGPWWITAKGWGWLNAIGGAVVSCRLSTSFDYDDTAVYLAGLTDSSAIGLGVTRNVTTSDDANLYCKSSKGFQVRDIQIAAIRAGRLTNHGIDGGGATYGTGTPRIISAFKDSAYLSGSSGANILGTITLPAGSWAVSAKVWVHESGGDSPTVACSLTAGADGDQVRVVLDPSFADDSLELQTAHTFASPGYMRLVCRQSGNHFQAQADFIKMTAIQASALTKVPL